MNPTVRWENGSYHLEWENDEDYEEFEIFVYKSQPFIFGDLRRSFQGTDLNLTPSIAVGVSETISIPNLPGNYELEARTQAIAFDGRVSNWSDWHAFTSSYDITPPPVPTNIQVQFFMNSDYRIISWNDCDAQDLDYYEIQRSVDGQAWGLSSLRKTRNSSMTVSDSVGLSKYRVRAIDRSGNRSEWGYPLFEFIINENLDFITYG